MILQEGFLLNLLQNRIIDSIIEQCKLHTKQEKRERERERGFLKLRYLAASEIQSRNIHQNVHICQ